MKKSSLLLFLALLSSPANADDQDTTIAKMQAQLNALAEQNRNLNGRVEDLQHQVSQPAAPAPYGVPVPQAPMQVAPMQAAPLQAAPMQVAPQPSFTPMQPPVAQMPPPYTQPNNIYHGQDIAPPADVQTAPAFPRVQNEVEAIPYTPPLQGQAVISPKLEQPNTVIGADGSAITKPNPYVTKVVPPLAPLPVTPVDDTSLEDEFDQIFQNVSSEDYVTAKPQLKAFIVKHPGTDLAGEAYYWLGEIAWSEKNYNEAAINYLKGYKEAPKGDKAPENILKMSLVLKQLGKNAEACKYISRFNTEFPTAHPDLKARAADARTELGCK